MVFIRKASQRLCWWCSYTKSRGISRVSGCRWDTGSERICRSFHGNASLCFKGTQTRLCLLICDAHLCLAGLTFCCYTTIWCLKKELISNAMCLRYWIYWINADFHSHCGRKVLQYMVFWCVQCVLRVKQTLWELHSVSYLNSTPPSPCLSSSEEQNLSNGNQLDVTKSLSADWQENSHE